MWYAVIYLLWIPLNILIAWANAQTCAKRLNHHDYRQINHFAWGSYYTCACLTAYLLFKSPTLFYIWILPVKTNWMYFFALLLQHLSFFPVAWNVFVKAPSIFFLSKKSSAKTDQFMVLIGLENTEWVNLGALVLSMFSLIFTIFCK